MIIKMTTKMRIKVGLLLLLLNAVVVFNSFGQVPLVYDIENTGANFPAPPLPAIGNLPVIAPLPDPFAWAAEPLGTTRSTKFGDWSHHRAEIKAQIENYEIGTKPAVDPSQVTASYSAGTLTVNVTVNGQTLTLTCAVTLPAGTGPFPAVIGMNSPNGGLPSSAFTSRNIAMITFSHNQVTTYDNPQNTDPYYVLYPGFNIDNTGQYSAWAWGVSRIIDGLAKVQNDLPIDIKHLAVTGCSYAGKMALFAGAFDERFALTIAQESGGGGATSWRYSATQSGVEGLAQTSHQWFSEGMFEFSGTNVSKLPEDHHMLMAMCAPRALFVTGNTDYQWLSNKSCYIASRAAQQIYDTLGIVDRFGFAIDGGHGHCAFPTSLEPQLGYFLDKFMKGQTNLSDTIEVFPSLFATLDYNRWSKWWGTGNPVFPVDTKAKYIWLEAECATVGSKWTKFTDTDASNGNYIVSDIDNVSGTSIPSIDNTQVVVFPFTVDTVATFSMLGRLNCPTANDDSYFVKVDNGSYTMINGLATSGWAWVALANSDLTKGAHTLTIAYRESGAKLDKILITTSGTAPEDLGDAATNCSGSVNQIPVANAGADQTVTDTDKSGTESVTLNGSGSTDSDGTISSYIWKEGANQIATEVNPSVNLAVGTHALTLTVTDNTGATATDDVVITVNAGSTAAEIVDNNNESINIYPNPVSSALNVALPGSACEIILYNSGGQQLLYMNTEKTSITIDMARFTSGIYSLKITNASQTIVKKIIKK